MPNRSGPGDLLELVDAVEPDQLSLMAAAVLTVTRARTRTADAAGTDLVPASPRELLAVLRATVIPRPRRDPGRLQVPESCGGSGCDRLGCIAVQARAS